MQTDATGRRPVRTAIRVAVVAAVVLVAAVLVRTLAPGGLARVLPGSGGRPTLVIVVPGTFGNTSFWTNLVPGQSTFASELQRATGPGTDVLPFLWASSTAHADRVAAAQNLARLIDERAPAYGHVYLVGHSHGGNVALLAAGLSHAAVDGVVCLSTPHLHLKTRTAVGSDANVPVYCTAATTRNVRWVVTVWPDTDQVPDGWANWQTGITDNEAVGLTAEARAALGEPRLADDGGPLTDLVLGPPTRVTALTHLENVPAAHNLVISSRVPDGFGSGAHVAVHSRRMGYVVGELLAADADAAGLASVAGVVQPADADDGGPVPDADRAAWYDQHRADVRVAGWRLDEADVRLLSAAKAAAGTLDGSDPRSYLRVTREGDGDPAVYDTRADARDGYTAVWRTRLVCFAGQTYGFDLRAAHLLPLIPDEDLGRQPVQVGTSDSETNPPRELRSAPNRGLFWEATLKWSQVHY